MLVGNGPYIIDGIDSDGAVVDVQCPPVVGAAGDVEVVGFPVSGASGMVFS